MAFYPYLNFGGNCGEAFTRYQEIFGGELFIMPMSEIPAEEGVDVPPEQQGLVAHAALMVGDGLLMASDAPGEFAPPRSIYVNYSTADKAEAERIWKELSADGTIEMDFSETFFSPGFGICVDRFGTPWMVNVQADGPPAG